jgi:hypothetical protein
MSIQGFTEALSAAYAALTEGQREVFDDEASSSCTGGSDTDGSSVFEIFENGYELGRSLAEGEQVFANHDSDRGVCFYVGTEESVLAWIAEVEEPEEEPEPETGTLLIRREPGGDVFSLQVKEGQSFNRMRPGFEWVPGERFEGAGSVIKRAGKEVPSEPVSKEAWEAVFVNTDWAYLKAAHDPLKEGDLVYHDGTVVQVAGVGP